MSKRNLHVPKSPQHRQAYHKYIETLDYEPTVDDRLNFQQTSQTGEDLREQTTARKRPAPMGQQLRDHMRSNWPVWALAIIGMAIVYLLFDSKVASARLTTQLESQQTHLNEARTCAREGEKHNQEQDIRIAETGTKLDGLGRVVDETRAEVKEMRRDLQSVGSAARPQQQRTKDAPPPAPAPP